jgi:NAD-dependent deacetylase
MIVDTEELITQLRAAGSIVVVTGSGVSAASGVPTFRGKDGLWRNVRAEDLATPDAFAHDPKTVWEWYDWRRTVIAGCQPNAAHEVLARWSTRPGFTLITQNVDGLHERVGTANVIRFHGSLWELRCAADCGAVPWEDRRTPLEPLPPSCPGCGGLARPGVVWYGETIDPDVLERSSVAAEHADVFLSVGTSSLVYPAAGLLHLARRSGAFTVEINPGATGESHAIDLPIAAPAEDALPMLEMRVRMG